MQSSCCNCLAELSCDNTNRQTIIEQNGIYILAVLLFPKDKELQRLETFIHLQVSIKFTYLSLDLRILSEIANSVQNFTISVSIQ